jgi:hypothetical protein
VVLGTVASPAGSAEPTPRAAEPDEETLGQGPHESESDGPLVLPAGGLGRAAVPTADFVPYVGSHTIGCTQGNPSPAGVCDHHHSYTGAIDFHMPIGVTIRSAGPGKVVFVNNTCAVGDTTCEGGGGRWVGVQHPDGKVSRYMHLQRASVTLGQNVNRGTVLGTSGFTGNSLVEHLHYDEQKPLYSRSSIGRVFACHGTRFVTYPDVLGYEAWADVPYGSVVRNDGYGCVGTLFLDVPNSHPFYDDIEWLTDEGITEGFVDGTFRPTDVVVRQAISAWMHRKASPTATFGNPGFVDVPPGHLFDEEIWWMVGTDRAEGYADNTFRPVVCVSRQGMAAFLYREAGAPPVAGPLTSFSDVPAGHPFATEITWLVREGIASGYTDGTFRPGACVTRQAAAAFLHRS